MKQSLTLTAIFEAATGLVLIITPSLVGRLLFGAEFTGVTNPVARVLGIALLALGVGCWPGSTALCGMLNTARSSRSTWLTSALSANGLGRCCGRQLSCTRSLLLFSPGHGSNRESPGNQSNRRRKNRNKPHSSQGRSTDL